MSHKQGDFNLRSIVTTKITEPIPQPALSQILSSPPFISLPGSFNARSLPFPIRSNYAFRSGTLENITTADINSLKSHNIKHIFDLRSLQETTDHPTPDIDDIEALWVPSSWDNETTSESRAAQYASDLDKFSIVKMYMDMLSSHKAILKIVLQHVRDRPKEAFLFHCTAGKDRTGVMAFLLLCLAGAEDDVMNLDYAHTRVGTEPVREFLLKKLAGGRELEEVMNDERVKMYSEMPWETMSDLRKAVEERWGSVEGYVRDVLDMGEEHTNTIKKHLRGD